MGFIDDELREVSKLCQNVIHDSRLVSCVPSMVRVEITRTSFKKIVVCLQFTSLYPKESLLIELKSNTLSSKLLNGLTEVCEKQCKNILGKGQILPTLQFIDNFIKENPLICCYDEISSIKKLLNRDDYLKLKQKSSLICLEIHEGAYSYKTRIVVPDDYPINAVKCTDVQTNFPPLFSRYILGQGQELARRCVEPPLKAQPDQKFSPSPSLSTVASFLIRTVKKFPNENCQLCKALCLPLNPADAILNSDADFHVERLYCGHLFHLNCFMTFMKTPPFHGGKKCPKCSQRVYHDKWSLNDKLAENRWAHEQARARELAEVADFFE